MMGGNLFHPATLRIPLFLKEFLKQIPFFRENLLKPVFELFPSLGKNRCKELPKDRKEGGRWRRRFSIKG